MLSHAKSLNPKPYRSLRLQGLLDRRTARGHSGWYVDQAKGEQGWEIEVCFIAGLGPLLPRTIKAP